MFGFGTVEETVIAGAAEGAVPGGCSVRVKSGDPKIILAESRRGLGSARRRGGETATDKGTVPCLDEGGEPINAAQVIVSATSEGPLPIGSESQRFALGGAEVEHGEEAGCPPRRWSDSSGAEVTRQWGGWGRGHGRAHCGPPAVSCT